MKKQLLKQNLIFCIIALIFVIGLIKQDASQETAIVSESDSEVAFWAGKMTLEQTWAPYMKEFSNIKIMCTPEDSFYGQFKVAVFSDDYTECLTECIIVTELTEGQSQELIFDFEPIQVDIGTRYRIQLSAYENSEKGLIKIPLSSGYAGCTVNGEEQGGAVAFSVGYKKTSTLALLIFAYLPVIIISLCFAVLFGRKMEDTLGIAFISVILILFFFGICGSLSTGIIGVFAVSFICFCVSVILCNCHKQNTVEYITPGLVSFGIMVIFLLVVSRNTFMKQWDEYSHWGLAAKDMFYYDSFGTHAGSSVLHRRYPPLSTLMEYFFLRINGIFSESVSYAAHLSLIISLLIGVFKNSTWKNIKACLPGFFICLFIPVVFFDYIFTLYVDLLLAALTAYVLMCYFGEKFSIFNGVRIIMGLVALVLTKDIGLVLAGLILLAIMLDMILDLWKKDKKIFNKQIAVSGLVYGLAIGCSFILWQFYLRISTATSSAGGTTKAIGGAISASKISVEGILDLLTFKAEEYKYTVIWNFIKTILSGRTYYVREFAFSYAAVWFICLVVTFIVCRKQNKEDEINRLSKYSILSGLIAFGYAAFLLITYVFTFSRGEALELASHSRYLASCVGGIFIAFWGLLLIKMQDMQDETKYVNARICIVCLCAVLMIGVPLKNFFPEKLRSHFTEETVAGYDKIEEVVRTVCDKNDRIYFVSSFDNGTQYFIFRTYVSPVKSPAYKEWDFYSSENIYYEASVENQISRKIIKTLDEWKDELMDYDYVFINYPSSYFVESYGPLFADPFQIGERTLFRVIKNGNDVELEYILTVK